jgi:flagellar biosynthetic protein FlhB
MSEESESSQEKSFDASQTKIRQSREKGDTPQSTEANTMMIYLGLALAIWGVGDWFVVRAHTSLTSMLARPSQIGERILGSYDGGDTSNGAASFFLDPIISTIPVFLILIVAVLVSLIVQRAIVFAPTKIQPKLSRISPLSNAKQKYGGQGMVEFGKRVIKLTFVGTIAGIFLWMIFPDLPGQAAIEPGAILPEMGAAAFQLTLCMVGAITIITLFDLPYSLFAHLKKLRMTLTEVRDENKESEGDPHMKSARRAKAQEISQASMLQDVKTADVIIVNPTHYAVALKWDRAAGGVPILIAKGIDEIAARIRQQAKLHDIAIYSDPPSARAIHAGVELGETIRPEHYAAVAASIHFADSFKRKPY